MDETCELGPRLAPEPSGNVRPHRGVSMSDVMTQGPGSGKGAEEGGKRQRRRPRQKTGSRIFVRTPLTACGDRDVKASPGAGLGPAEPVREAGGGQGTRGQGGAAALVPGARDWHRDIRDAPRGQRSPPLGPHTAHFPFLILF